MAAPLKSTLKRMLGIVTARHTDCTFAGTRTDPSASLRLRKDAATSRIGMPIRVAGSNGRDFTIWIGYKCPNGDGDVLWGIAPEPIRDAPPLPLNSGMRS